MVRNPIGGPNDHRHGTVNGYGNLRCRCPRCRAANTAQMRVARARMRAAVAAGQRDLRHGTTGGYTNYGCHCEHCSRAERDAAANRYRGRILNPA